MALEISRLETQGQEVVLPGLSGEEMKKQYIMTLSGRISKRKYRLIKVIERVLVREFGILAITEPNEYYDEAEKIAEAVLRWMKRQKRN